MSMLIAILDKNPCKRLHIHDYKKEEHSGRITCCYGHDIIAKQGTKKTWHFAHVSATDSDCAKLMGDWHHWWQDRVESDFLEIVMIKEIEGRAVKHRADMINGEEIVVEFQKSVINQQIIMEREGFYGNMIWVVCCDEQHSSKTVKQRGRYVRIRITSGSKFFLDMRKLTFLDFGMKGVIEVIKYLNVQKSKPEIIGKIWLQHEFDEKYMLGCLRKDADHRTHRPPYQIDNLEENFEETEKFLMAKNK